MRAECGTEASMSRSSCASAEPFAMRAPAIRSSR
jgi:hypothetical protein